MGFAQMASWANSGPPCGRSAALNAPISAQLPIGRRTGRGLRGHDGPSCIVWKSATVGAKTDFPTGFLRELSDCSAAAGTETRGAPIVRFRLRDLVYFITIYCAG